MGCDARKYALPGYCRLFFLLTITSMSSFIYFLAACTNVKAVHVNLSFLADLLRGWMINHPRYWLVTFAYYNQHNRSFTFPDSYTIWLNGLREATAMLEPVMFPCSNLNRWTTKWMEMTLITSGTGLIKEEAARESHVSNSATDTSRVAAQLGSTARSIKIFLIRQVLRHSMWLVWQLNVP